MGSSLLGDGKGNSWPSRQTALGMTKLLPTGRTQDPKGGKPGTPMSIDVKVVRRPHGDSHPPSTAMPSGTVLLIGGPQLEGEMRPGTQPADSW